MKKSFHQSKAPFGTILSRNVTFYFYTTSFILLSIFSTSCIPTVVTPTNTFNVNLVAGLSSNTDTSIIIDGDTLNFRIQSSPFYFTLNNFLFISTNTANFEILNVKKHFHDNTTNQFDTTTALADINTLNYCITINNTYSTHPWSPFIFSSNTYQNYCVLYQTTDGFPNGANGLIANTNEYIVLRKLKNTQYQYYWIKARMEVVTNVITFKILNGKYKMNSIITGL